jgi:hypothetical protein
MSRKSDFSRIGDVLKNFQSDEDKYISQEFQKYGYELAKELEDIRHKALYIKLAKETPRILLEKARSFVKDAANVDNKGALFMWKLKKLKDKDTKL